jgi:hypothetical protein
MNNKCSNEHLLIVPQEQTRTIIVESAIPFMKNTIKRL